MSSTMQNKLVAKSIAKLYLHSNTADVHFAFKIDDETVKVPAHKAILAIASPVFEAMFFGPMKENDVVEIVDASASAFEEFLQLFYLPEVTLTMENIEAVARLADKYDMLKCLNESASSFLENQLTDDNVIWGYQLAISLINQPLKLFCESQIKMLTNCAFKSDTFLHCDKAVVEHILKLESLPCTESDLFFACIEWAKSTCEANGLDESDPGNLKNQLGHCFYLIRFGAMTIKEIGMILSNEQYRELFSRNELADLICMKSDGGFESKVFKHTQRSIRALKWNADEVLTCALVSAGWANTQSQESTWFSVNIPVLLGKIMCAFIYDNGDSSENISSKMSIIEYNEQTFVATAATKVLYTETVTSMSATSILLPEPIVVHPEKMYEIRFEFQINTNEYLHFSQSKSEHKLDGGVTVKIHQNPSEYESDRRGLVSELRFNKI